MAYRALSTGFLAAAALLLALASSGASAQQTANAPAAPRQQPQQQLQLPGFNGVVSCAPFTVLVEPAGTDASGVLLQAPPAVADSIALAVVGAAVALG
jgi:hypothetical protein